MRPFLPKACLGHLHITDISLQQEFVFGIMTPWGLDEMGLLLCQRSCL